MNSALTKVLNRLNSKLFIYIVLGFLIISVSYQSYTKSKIIDQLTSQQNRVTEISELIGHDKEQINVLVTDNQSNFKEVKKLNIEVASLSRRMDEVQQYQLDQALNQKREDDARPSYEDINSLQSQLASLQFQIKDLNQKIYELNKTSITSTINKQTQASPLSIPVETLPTAVVKTQNKPVLKPLIPPFTVLGIESRGGELFVSIAPSKSASLNQIKLLRVGDSYRNWQLTKINTSAAVFTVGTRQQIIAIR